MRFYDIGESPLMGLTEKCIAPLVLGGIVAAGASLAGNAIGSASQNKTNQTSIDINRENNAFVFKGLSRVIFTSVSSTSGRTIFWIFKSYI